MLRRRIGERDCGGGAAGVVERVRRRGGVRLRHPAAQAGLLLQVGQKMEQFLSGSNYVRGHT